MRSIYRLMIGGTAGLLVALASTPAMVEAQTVGAIKHGKPLSLKARGSFYVGGETVKQSPVELGSFGVPGTGEAGDVAEDALYVEYMVPTGAKHPPVVMIHGVTLTGKSFDTTPDGRMGWYEAFVRAGFPAYLVDTVGRGRSGFNQAILNNVRAGKEPPANLGEARRMSADVVWKNFRFGPREGEPFPDGQFPVEAVGELAKQSIPDLDAFLPSLDATTKSVAELSRKIGGAVLLGHSMGAYYPIQAALADPKSVRAIILVESCSNDYSDDQIKTLSTIPILIIWGDHIDNPTGIEGWNWRAMHDDCRKFVTRVTAQGGKADIWDLPERGLKGNSHMLMMDRNSLEIARMIQDWIKRSL